MFPLDSPLATGRGFASTAQPYWPLTLSSDGEKRDVLSPVLRAAADVAPLTDFLKPRSSGATTGTSCCNILLVASIDAWSLKSRENAAVKIDSNQVSNFTKGSESVAVRNEEANARCTEDTTQGHISKAGFLWLQFIQQVSQVLLC